MMSDPTTRFVKQYQNLTLAQLKELNYQGQGQIQQGDQLWQAHLTNQAHNITQQLYVSHKLWSMIELYKDQTISVITDSFLIHERADITSYVNDLLAKNEQLSKPMGAQVKSAIKKEIELYFNL